MCTRVSYQIYNKIKEGLTYTSNMIKYGDIKATHIGCKNTLSVCLSVCVMPYDTMITMVYV